ncbi:hypothetical protein CRYUN_Cryun09bG0126400 [Craigia yunnanensis]
MIRLSSCCLELRSTVPLIKSGAALFNSKMVIPYLLPLISIFCLFAVRTPCYYYLLFAPSLLFKTLSPHAHTKDHIRRAT